MRNYDTIWILGVLCGSYGERASEKSPEPRRLSKGGGRAERIEIKDCNHEGISLSAWQPAARFAREPRVRIKGVVVHAGVGKVRIWQGSSGP